MKKLGAIILVLGLMTMGLVFLPSASAPPTGIDLSEGKYTGNIGDYVPTEEIEIIIYGPDTEEYDISIRESASGLQKKFWDNEEPNTDGELMLIYDIPSGTSDGWYDIYVCDSAAPTCDWGSALIWDGYWVQLWTIDIETDRGRTGTFQDWSVGGDIGDGSYLDKEIVTVHYSITYRKDNMPVQSNDGYLDWIALDDNGGVINGDQDEQVDGIGTFTFKVAIAGLSDDWWDDYQVRAWYNESTGVSPENMAFDMEYFYVGSLGVDVSLPFGGTYAPGDHVMVDVTLFVDMGDTGDGIWQPWNEHEVIPGTPLDDDTDPAQVDVNVFEWDDSDWVAQTQYDIANMIPDYHGVASYIFTLDSDIGDLTDFRVSGTGTYVTVEITSSDLFTVTITGALTVEIELDKLSFISGETITATATVQTSGTEATQVVYTFGVFERVTWNVYVLLDEQIGTENSFQYTTAVDFEGTLEFRVNAKNVDGYEDDDTISTSVVMGVLLVNADREEYNAGDNIKVSYELVGPLADNNPTYYYTVRDGTGVIIESGEDTDGSFDFSVPAIPSNWYTFGVYAYVDGRTLSGSDSVSLVRGYFLSISFDKEIYSLGDTMTIKYTITARGDSKLPSSFIFQFNLGGGPGGDYQAANTEATVGSGEFTYLIPSSAMDEGTLIFYVNEWNTGSSATEVITVRGGNPLWWAKLAEIPAFDILLLILIIILFILLLKMRAGRAPAAAAEAAPVEEAPPPTAPGETPPPPSEPGMEAAAGASALSVPCKSCGSPIELTTSKRPIEVMCPSCGETQMAY